MTRSRPIASTCPIAGSAEAYAAEPRDRLRHCARRRDPHRGVSRPKLRLRSQARLDQQKNLLKPELALLAKSYRAPLFGSGWTSRAPDLSVQAKFMPRSLH